LVQKLLALKFKQKVLNFRKFYTPKFLGCYMGYHTDGDIRLAEDLRLALTPLPLTLPAITNFHFLTGAGRLHTVVAPWRANSVPSARDGAGMQGLALHAISAPAVTCSLGHRS
jgi:hypothetical protein